MCDTTEPLAAPAHADGLIRFWQAAGRDRWFTKDAEFDRTFHERFARWHEAAAAGLLAGWAADAQGTLALLLLLDQFPRNAFRGTPRMYATDALARTIAVRAIAAGQDQEVAAELRIFIYLPLGHSEDLADQERVVGLAAHLGEKTATASARHRDIIRRFGRFPHRNAILGRQSTEDEEQFLREGGFAG